MKKLLILSMVFSFAASSAYAQVKENGIFDLTDATRDSMFVFPNQLGVMGNRSVKIVVNQVNASGNKEELRQVRRGSKLEKCMNSQIQSFAKLMKDPAVKKAVADIDPKLMIIEIVNNKLNKYSDQKLTYGVTAGDKVLDQVGMSRVLTFTAVANSEDKCMSVTHDEAKEALIYLGEESLDISARIVEAKAADRKTKDLLVEAVTGEKSGAPSAQKIE